MKILERYDQTKEVQAWGETWTVPVWCKYIKVMSNGFVYAATNQNVFYGKSRKIALVNFYGLHEESLVYVGEQ